FSLSSPSPKGRGDKCNSDPSVRPRTILMTPSSEPPAMLFHAELPPVAKDLKIMGMPAVSPEITTIAALQALPDDGMRHELLDGVHAVTPSPVLLHQVMLREIEHRIATALEGQDRFQVLWSPADIVLG